MATRTHAKRKPAAAVVPADKALFTTSRGVTIKLSKYNTLSGTTYDESVAADWQDAGKALPVKPTYEIVAAGDVVEIHEHDAKSIKGNAQAEADWAVWEQANREFQQDVFDVSRRSFIIDCMQFDIQPQWQAKAKAKRLHVPADEYEAKVFWAQTEVWDGMADFQNAVLVSVELAGVTGPQLEAARTAFRRSLEVPTGDAR